MNNNSIYIINPRFQPIGEANPEILQTAQGISTGRNVCPVRTRQLLSDLFQDKASQNMPFNTTFWGHLKNLPDLGHDVFLNPHTGEININGITLSYMTPYKPPKKSGMVSALMVTGKKGLSIITDQFKYALYPDPVRNPYIQSARFHKRPEIVHSTPMVA